MVKNDKLLNGFMAGLAGCLVKDLLTAVLEIFKLKPTYWDYGEYLIYQKIHISTGTVIAGIFVEVIFGVFLAVLYAHLKHLIETNHPLFRGFTFGILVWFGSRSLITLAHVKILMPYHLIMIPSNAFIGGIYGIVVAYVLKRLEKRSNQIG